MHQVVEEMQATAAAAEETDAAADSKQKELTEICTELEEVTHILSESGQLTVAH